MTESLTLEAGSIMSRVQALRPDSARQWGTMTAGEMVVHCADQMRVCRGEKAVTSVRLPRLLRPLVKWIFVTRRKAFKPGMKTIRELDARAGMTPLTSFDEDRRTLLRLVGDSRGGGVVGHPLFGTLTAPEAEELSLRHLDYHLRQFGV